MHSVDQKAAGYRDETLSSMCAAFTARGLAVLTERDQELLLDRMMSLSSHVADLTRKTVGRSLLYIGVSPRDPLVRRLTAPSAATGATRDRCSSSAPTSVEGRLLGRLQRAVAADEARRLHAAVATSDLGATRDGLRHSRPRRRGTLPLPRLLPRGATVSPSPAAKTTSPRSPRGRRPTNRSSSTAAPALARHRCCSRACFRCCAIGLHPIHVRVFEIPRRSPQCARHGTVGFPCDDTVHDLHRPRGASCARPGALVLVLRSVRRVLHQHPRPAEHAAASSFI